MERRSSKAKKSSARPSTAVAGAPRRTSLGGPNRIDLNNYMADPSKKNDLKNRLYDSGISNVPMPSVKRPIEEYISSRPYSAKMNPNQIQSLTKVKKKIDGVHKDIYANLQDSYKEAAAQEAKYKGEGTAEYYKAQHIMVPPHRIRPQTGVQRRLVPKLLKRGDGSSSLAGVSSTNKILLNRGPKPGQLPTLAAARSMADGEFGEPDPDMRLLQGPPATAMTGFEGGYSMNQKNLELARSKFLVDKLTAKLPQYDKKARPKTGHLPPLSDSGRDLISRGSRSQLSQKNLQEIPDLDEEHEEQKKGGQHTLQKWSDLDKYIELLLDSKSEEETVFVYLNTNENNDPYDLLVCSYDQRKPQKYYTLSGKGLTLYENDTPQEFISLGQWLIERDSYNHIKELNFFKKFKKWKFMRMWRKTIKHQTRMKAQNSLEDRLFILQDYFGTYLSRHRDMMIQMEGCRFIDPCQNGDTKTLDDFAEAQVEKTNQIADQIQIYSDKCRENIRECISKVLTDLRTRIVSEIQLDEDRKKNNPINTSTTINIKKKAQSNVFEKLGFPEGMTYGHRSSLRKECSRFLRFAYLVDFLSLEALKNIYLGSVRDMITRLETLDNSVDMEVVMKTDYSDQNQAAAPARGQEPLFHVGVKVQDDVEIPEADIVLVEIDEFILPPRGKSKCPDFDPLAHLELEEPRDEDDSDDMLGEGVEHNLIIEPIYKKTVPNIQERWLKTEPDQHDYIEVIIRTFGAGLDQIKQFERWSKHNDLTPYADALEEWDDIVGDKWEEPESLKLDPKTWIMDDPLYIEQRSIVERILESAYGKTEVFMTRFQPILEIYFRNKLFDLSILANEQLKNPIEGLNNTINLFLYQKELFASNLPTTAEIGLIQLDSKLARKLIEPTPKEKIEQIEKYIPSVIKERNDAAKKWLEQGIRDLDRQVSNVEEYVEQLDHYNYIDENFQIYRDRVDIFGQTYHVFAEKLLKVRKEDKDSFNESLQAIGKLSFIKEKVESQQEENKEKFKKELNQLIPKLSAEIDELNAKAQDPKFLDGNNMEKMFDMLQELDNIEATFKKLEERKETYNRWQEYLDLIPDMFENLDECRERMTLRCLMWRSLHEWQDYNEKWYETQFSLVDAKEISTLSERYAKNCMRLEKNLEPNEIQVKLKELVTTFKEAMPIVNALRNDKLTEVHWAKIKALIKKDIDVTDEKFTLKALIDLDVNQFQEEITTISTQATQEANLRAQLNEIEEVWRKIGFELKWDDGCETYILVEMDDIFTALDESLANVNMILGSRFVAPLRADAEALRKHVSLLSDTIDEWLMCQKNWRYLKNIFSGPEIKRSLPEATAKFVQVDRYFGDLMKRTQRATNCLRTVKLYPLTHEQLIENNKKLDGVQKQLEQYMEMKRSAFPRFYFLSDDELINILAKSKDYAVVQQHLKTCFDNIIRVEIDEDDNVQSMSSAEKEEVPFKKPVRIGDAIEKWLDNLQNQMKDTLYQLMKVAINDYVTQDRTQFVLSHKGQIVACLAQIQWCQGTEDHLNDYNQNPLSLIEWHEVNVKQLASLTQLVIGKLEDLHRKIIVALITTDVHARDIVETLKDDGVSSPFAFKWQQQLRYYWEEVDGAEDCRIKQVSACLTYGYEYMGATSRLVITPLTDRCWITISNALHIKLGANPAGPAGTGKTESTKDLAKAIAIQCIVFNCSDQVNYIMMGRLFSGLCQQGCWTCLDEFNRIEVEVLSVIAQQLLQVRTALLLGKTEFPFQDGEEIPLKTEFGCHVTMNPGYAGRTELPDNLKVLFRPVAMMIPDYAMIAEIMLFAEGFGNARVLSKKMHQLYKLSSEQLSKQDHYDFGLRAVKSVLVMAGALKRASPDLVEDSVLIRAMRDANIPKFLKDDIPLFSAIIQDLFPSVEITENDYGNLKVTIERMIEAKDLQRHEPFIVKVIQLFETFNVRFGVMLVGFTGSGKTTCWEILQDTMTYLREKNDENQVYQVVKKIVLNPKSISMGELYGFVDEVSQEWSDGLASKVMRAAAQELEEDKTWVIFDGPVDALWIESMNTVLDDNMTLCLANGQRIKLRPQMRMLFEVNDLAVASPATVSRCGMVYLTQDELGWEPYVKTWLVVFFDDPDLMSEDLKDHLWATFKATVDVGLEYIRGHFAEPIATTDLQQVVSLCNFLELFVDEAKGFKGNDEEKKYLLDCLFAFSYAWGLGGSLDQNDKETFHNKIVSELFKKVPQAYTVYDYYFDLRKEKAFKPWAGKVPAFVYDKELPYFDLMVPTQDTYKYSFLMESLLSIEKHLFFTGVSGVGKSAIIAKSLQQSKDKGSIQPIYLNMSAQTSSQQTQQAIETKLEKKKRTILGAQPGKKVAVFVDDINMPAVETYGAQPPIEFLRLFLDRKGLYVRKEWVWKEVEDTTIIACAAPPSGGRAELSQRFSGRFNMFCLPKSSGGTLATIFSSILKGFLSCGFAEKVKHLEEAAINSTIDIYTQIQIDLRPTPAKFHYLFNLRDVSKVVQGICMTKPVSIQTDETFAKLWVNECFRVFYDRLISDEDRKWFKSLIMDLLSKNFKSGVDADELFANLRFGDLLRLDSPTQYYEYIASKDKLLKVLYDNLDEYNLGNANKMNLVLFDDAVEHVLRISRCLKQPRGHIMLIGVGGSGKQSLIKLSSYMRQMEFKQVEINKDFGLSTFLEFMKELMKAAGIEGQGISFTMTDTQIIAESFIENLNNLLNTGEIPNLMKEEDKEEIVNGVRPVCQQKKIVDSLDNVNALFVDRVREFLHICLCMSPVGDTLRVRCRQFPSLVNCCTLDYFSSWPAIALLFVSSEFLKELPDTSEEERAGLSEMCMKIHTSVEDMAARFWHSLRRRIYTTPKSYLDLISLYMKVLEAKRHEFETNRSRLAIGLKKLNDTNEEIAILKDKIEEMQPKLEAKNEELKVALVKVNADKEVADEEEKVVSAEAEIVNKQAEEAKAIADDAQADLDAAKPELMAAQDAVQRLDKQAIVEIKNYAQPPEAVKFVMQCVAVLLSEKPDWANIKTSVMSNVGDFMSRLLNYDVEKTSEKIWKKARDTYISNSEFEPSKVKTKSIAAAALCVWCRACSSYQYVVKKVAPKKAKFAEVTEILNRAQATLQVKLDKVAKVKAEVAKLEAECQQMQDEKEALEFEMDRSSKRMVRAEKLVVLLKDEGIRWKETVETIQGEIVRLVGNVFLSCACISYFGGFTGEFRVQLVEQWVEGCLERNIPTSEDFSLVHVMGDPVVLRGWGIAGLPSDQVSLENGILTTGAERYALCIDPQQQANKWIRNMEKDNGLVILKSNAHNFLRHVTGAVRTGKPCLVEDLEEHVDPALDPILLKQQFQADAGIWQIRLGDATVDYDEQFRFFMTTKMPNPHYIPEICIKVTLINFTVTFDGLQQQLLGDVVIAEKPEIEAKKDEIVLSLAADAKTLKDLENTILKKLSEATTEQILDEDALIDMLDDSKRTSREINERVDQAKTVEAEINDTRNLYTSIAIRGSILYFVIADMSKIDPMYQNSLAYVKTLFNKAIDMSPQAPTIEERLAILIDKITKTIYTNISRGLFERDKIIFSFLIATSIKRQAKAIDEAAWGILLRGPTIFTAEEAAAKLDCPDYEVMLHIPWDTLCSAELRCTNGQFAGLTGHICEHWGDWREWQQTENPYQEKLPGEFSQTLSSFDRLILIRSWRPDLVQSSMSQYILNEMERFFVESPSVSMGTIYKDINPCTPLIFVLSTGADPTSLLLNFASEMGFHEKLNPISLGQGQGPKATALVTAAKRDGEWVMLQNCHLARSWMPELERMVLGFAEEAEIHPDFRLYLTSMPAPYFPVAVLQNSLKLTTEPPRGLRANLKRTYSNLIGQEVLDKCSKPAIWRKLLFNFAFFHATIQERRKFGPLGWNIQYEFNDSDLETTNTMLRLFLDNHEEIPWDALLFVTGDINYGGRVTDDNDRVCLQSTLAKYCHLGALSDSYRFSPSGTYYAPPDGDLSVYTDYIDSLPMTDNPEIFGLGDNANIIYETQESGRIIETLLGIQPRVAGGTGGLTPDEIVLGKSKELSEQLPQPLDWTEGLKELFVKNDQGLIPSLSTVLLQEIEKFNRLLKEMKTSLIDIDLAVKGFIVMSETLDLMYVSLQNNQVPANWRQVAYPSLKPLASWFRDLIDRVDVLNEWLRHGNPTSYWLPGMFFPQGFMTGVLQTHARQHKIAIDLIQFAFEILRVEGAEEIDEPPEDGVYIYGLFIDGARWDRDQQLIVDQLPSRMSETMPVLWFNPKELFKQDPDDYQAPLYKTSLRAGVLSTTGQSTNYILHVSIPSREPPQFWITRAAALLCMLND